LGGWQGYRLFFALLFALADSAALNVTVVDVDVDVDVNSEFFK
jgi:hypothetical protein